MSLRLVAALTCAVVLAGACSSGSSGGGSADTAPVTEAAGPPPVATVTSEQEVDPSFRQGLAKADAGWVFSTNLVLFRTDDNLVITRRQDKAIPEKWASQGFDHIGDVDVADGIMYAPVEQPGYSTNRQAMFRYDAATLDFLDAVPVAQAHNAWVAVDPDTMTAYSMSGFSDNVVRRYDILANWEPLDSVMLDRTLERVQGGDVRDGYLWLSTDDATNGLYRVDLRTGAVASLGSIGRVDGEGEGIDATVLPSGALHVLGADPAGVPMRLVNLAVS
jgi:hypothetical protein